MQLLAAQLGQTHNLLASLVLPSDACERCCESMTETIVLLPPSTPFIFEMYMIPWFFISNGEAVKVNTEIIVDGATNVRDARFAPSRLIFEIILLHCKALENSTTPITSVSKIGNISANSNVLIPWLII